MDLPFGQHRWIEYSDIHNFDASNIQPEWHGWMHHVYDETPDQDDLKAKFSPTVEHSDAKYDTHLGAFNDVSLPQNNVSFHRYY